MGIETPTVCQYESLTQLAETRLLTAGTWVQFLQDSPNEGLWCNDSTRGFEPLGLGLIPSSPAIDVLEPASVGVRLITDEAWSVTK